MSIPGKLEVRREPVPIQSYSEPYVPLVSVRVGEAAALTALILGVCSILPVVGFLTGLAAIILGIVALAKNTQAKGKAIVGIVLGIVLPQFGTFVIPSLVMMGLTSPSTSAKKDAVVSVISQVETALETYQLHIGHFPTQEEGGLAALRTQPTFSEEGLGEKWHGPYLKVDPVDPWNKPLNYQAVDAGSEEAKTVPFKVWSNGPNGTDENGEGDDIKSKAWKAAK